MSDFNWGDVSDEELPDLIRVDDLPPFPELSSTYNHYLVCDLFSNPAECLCDKPFSIFLLNRNIDDDYQIITEYLVELRMLFENSRRNPELLPSLSRRYCNNNISLYANTLKEKLYKICTATLLIIELREEANIEIRNHTVLLYYNHLY